MEEQRQQRYPRSTKGRTTISCISYRVILLLLLLQEIFPAEINEEEIHFAVDRAKIHDRLP